MDVQRKEDGFDLTGPNSPLSHYSLSNGTKSVCHTFLPSQWKNYLKSYFYSAEVLHYLFMFTVCLNHCLSKSYKKGK